MSELKKVKFVINTYPELQPDIKVFVKVMERIVLTRKGFEIEPTVDFNSEVETEPLQDRNVTSTTTTSNNNGS